ncbi:MAG: accessory Sec system translocase SecA2 [Acidobacteriia bacterium]|nr:accessory Sec system translocase SecA2 [Terriglobia bacterium]
MRQFLKSLFSGKRPTQSAIQRINALRAELSILNEDDLRSYAGKTSDRLETLAAAAVVAERVLGLRMFDVQLHGALALTAGRIAEMQTGEGKTLVAVPAAIWLAKAGEGVHVLTVNDYLARRDAQWMGDIYRFFGLTVGYIQREMPAAERQSAYACDVTYATANEVGFDYLRGQMALSPAEQVHRPFGAAVIDEADSILIDEARIPLVIAGGDTAMESLPHRVDTITRHFRRGAHYTVDEYGRNVALTDQGVREVERAFHCGNLFAEENLTLHAAAQESVHAHALLRRDVDYLVKDGAIESVDEFKGRVIQDRRWPAGLHAAIEAKEGVALRKQGRVLGSITLQNLVALYPRVCGMTGTAATQADEFRMIYSLAVEVIPTNRPVIRVDHPDVIFRTKREKDDALLEEIDRVHQTGQPVLVGTASVEESERLSGRLHPLGIAHQVLNARNEEHEAAIVARAGERGAVTISTNMAGRGTDIKLGPGVAELGGLLVLGANRHESRRIDNQLRGRAGRQGDPGSSRFFVSLEDDLLVRYGSDDPLFRGRPDDIQRVIEGQNLDIRRFLHKYEATIEGQRLALQEERQALLHGESECASELERLVRLTVIDDQWADYLAAVAELRSGIHWVSWANRDPLHEYLVEVDRLFQQLHEQIEQETAERLERAEAGEINPRQRGATWTYLTTDQPFGTLTERILRGFMKKIKSKN